METVWSWILPVPIKEDKYKNNKQLYLWDNLIRISFQADKYLPSKKRKKEKKFKSFNLFDGSVEAIIK